MTLTDLARLQDVFNRAGLPIPKEMVFELTDHDVDFIFNNIPTNIPKFHIGDECRILGFRVKVVKSQPDR